MDVLNTPNDQELKNMHLDRIKKLESSIAELAIWELKEPHIIRAVE